VALILRYSAGTFGSVHVNFFDGKLGLASQFPVRFGLQKVPAYSTKKVENKNGCLVEYREASSCITRKREKGPESLSQKVHYINAALESLIAASQLYPPFRGHI
jgi:hypothetical protein